MLKILIDSREQKRLVFKQEETEVRCLDVGDYGAEIDGKVAPIFFERKGLGDLYGTMTHGYLRFKEEMKRAEEAQVKLILVVEGSLETVLQGYEHSQFDGKSMIQKLSTLYVKYDLETYYMNSRDEMRRFIEETFRAVERCWGR